MLAAPNGTVLIIDDEEDRSLIVPLQQIGLTADLRHPRDVGRDDVARADVVLVDHQLHQWPERDEAAFALQPRDGIALGTLLRRQTCDNGRYSPTAFAIRTGHMEALASPLPPESRNHVLAALNNFEWVFNKQDDDRSVAQIESLVRAVQSLPQAWPIDDAAEGLRSACLLLGIDPDVDVKELRDAMGCLPPLHSMSSWSHGLAFLRWILHRILPYPCFLFDAVYLAARLRVSREWLEQILNSGPNTFDDCLYRGILGGFLGKRWWRSRIESKIWASTEGDSLNGPAIRKWLEDATRQRVAPSETDDYPVICRDADHRPLSRVFPMAQSVQIQPDDWPSYAEPAWTTSELADTTPALSALIKQEG